jgi:phospholipase C
LADVHYRLGHHDRFGYFSKTGLPWRTILDVTVNPKIPSFLEDAAAGTLRQVSWIDPAFTNFNLLGFPVNDDHPPADIKDGQDLVLAIYDALASSPQWERSLLVIVYDENGGFYDHVPPPQSADDEPEMFGSYGVRVPAIIVSPWIEPRTVSRTLFDHTSIIKTILSRFCPKALHQPQRTDARQARPGPRPQYPGLRVSQASHLGELLTRTTPRAAPLRDTLVRQPRPEPPRPRPTSPRPGARTRAIIRSTIYRKACWPRLASSEGMGTHPTPHSGGVALVRSGTTPAQTSSGVSKMRGRNCNGNGPGCESVQATVSTGRQDYLGDHDYPRTAHRNQIDQR